MQKDRLKLSRSFYGFEEEIVNPVFYTFVKFDSGV